MKILFLGDIVGKPGRLVVMDNLPRLIDHLKVDFCIVNGENAAHGFGINAKICEDLFAVGVDVITLGNHAWDKAEIIPYIRDEPRLIRPDNFGDKYPGKGSGVFQTKSGENILVINVMCRLFMEALDNPFTSLDKLLPEMTPGDCGLDAVVVDMHGEATSEKYAIGHFCDGRASLVVGTHTHVPTADHHILNSGTAYQSDAGMCGDYDSIIGMNKQSALGRMLGELPKPRLKPAEGEGTLAGTLIETDIKTGLAKNIKPIRIGGSLSTLLPI